MQQPPILVQAQLQPAHVLSFALPDSLQRLGETVLAMAVDLKAMRQDVQGFVVDLAEIGQAVTRIGEQLMADATAQTKFNEMLQAVQSMQAYLETLAVPLLAMAEQQVQTLEDKDTEDSKARREALRQAKQMVTRLKAEVRSVTPVPAAAEEEESSTRSRGQSQSKKAESSGSKTESKASE